MELREYLTLFRKRWLMIVIAALLGSAVGLGYSLIAAPQYTAKTQVVVSAQQSGTVTTDELLQGANYSRNQVSTYVQLVGQPLILEPVIKELGLDTTSEDLAEHISASNPTNTTIIDVSVTYPSGPTAADIANATAKSMGTTIQEMETPVGATASRVKLTTSSPATVPEAPSSPNLPLALALGLILGLVTGAIIAVTRELLDTGIKLPEDLRPITDASVIGVVPDTTSADRESLIVNSAPTSTRAEAYRKLRTNLRFVDVEHGPRSIVMTSSIPGEAKTTTSINLAYSIATAGMRVCLVEADLRRPKLGTYLGLESSVGLTTVLIGQVNLAGALQPFGGVPTLHVMTAGQVPPNPAEWLGSASMNRLIRSLEQQYDMVIVDAPPLLPVTDAAVLSGIVGGTLLVVGSGKVHQAEVERSLQSLATVDAKLLGIVMTFLKTRRFDAYGSTYSYSYEMVDEHS